MSKLVKRGRRDPSKKLNLDAALPPLALQHAWYEMMKHRKWTSLAIVPVTETGETLRVAHGFGLMAIREPHDMVWVVNASSISGDVVKPSDVNLPGLNEFPYKFANLSELGVNLEKQLFTAERMLEKVVEQDDMNIRFIAAVDSIIDNTHPIALCRTVDAVVLCITLGMTTLSSVRRVVEIIGKERIIGSIVLRPAAS